MPLKNSISYFKNIMYKHIFLNFSENSFINKEMISLFQLHTYKLGLVYIVHHVQLYIEYRVLRLQKSHLLWELFFLLLVTE